MSALSRHEAIAPFAAIGITAFTTTRAAGDFALGEMEPLPAGVARWEQLVQELTPEALRLASARQVHGATVLTHEADFRGWRRQDAADGHFTHSAGTALAITVADCVPIFLGHPSGAIGLLHAGWRGTVAHILEVGIARFTEAGLRVEELRMHLGPAICGRCYEVGPEVFEQLTGWSTTRTRHVDLRALLAEQARNGGVQHLSASPYCTRCDNDRFFSHRCGDAQRQVAVILS